MKKSIFFFLMMICLGLFVLAQAPQAFKYQTVARNSAGEILASQNIKIRISLLKNSRGDSNSPGEYTVLYTETHSAITNASGLVTLEIGYGTPISGDFAAINRSAAPILLKTEVDPAGGSAFVEMGNLEWLNSPSSSFSANGIQSMTTNERDAVENPSKGMQIYNINTNCINYYNGASWVKTGSPITQQPTEAGSGDTSFYNMDGQNTSPNHDRQKNETDEECLINISCPYELFQYTDPGECGAYIWDLGALWVDATCGISDIWNDSPGYFSTGTTIVTWFAVDFEGNMASCEQFIFVYDYEFPVITCPPDISQMADSGEFYATIVDLGALFATDNCEISEVFNNAPDNNQYPVGTTIVTWTVKDFNFNQNSCGQLITVTGILPQVFAGNDATVNEGEFYSLTGAMANHCSSLLWLTSGDGTFNNATLLNPEYTPGDGDIIEGMAELCLTGISDIGETTDCMKLTINGIHSINLPEGWTSISSYLVPNQQDVALMMAAIEEKLIILSDFEGNIYQPENKNLINWNFTKGYYIKMASPDTLQIYGLYPMNKQLELQEGWNLIPVLSDSALAIEDLFYGNLQKVEIITEVAGVNVYWPEHEIATLHQLMPGKAYLVKASEAFILSKLPDVTTTSLSNITGFSATSGGSATNEGSWPVTSRGIVWSTTQTPTISNYDGITNDGDGSGNWVSELTGLIPFTTYYVRAYATNFFGTAYGEELMFTTLFACGYPISDSRDGKTYTTVQIGTQCWMAQNLNIGTRITGTSNQTNNSTIEKYCYNNTEANCDVYGGLYQWNEMMKYATTAGVQGICMTGWHLPTDAEWTTLTTYVSSQTVYRCNSNSAYIAKAMASTSGWQTTNGTCEIGNYQAGNNATGFTGLPGGERDIGGSFYDRSQYGRWWSSSQNDASRAWFRSLLYSYANVNGYHTYKSRGFSVRCLKD